jgi:N-acetylglucosaminyl-diphospho-decaprenol L-rhamnosyltransferase
MTTAVVVTYRSSDWIRRCLTALASIPTIVVDNASPDDTVHIVASEFPDVRLVVRVRNDGFGAAVNDAIRLEPIEDLLVLNPDVLVDRVAVARLQAYLDANPRVGIAAPKLRYPDGRTQESIRTFPNPLALLARRSIFANTRPGRRVLRRYLLEDADLEAARPIEWAIGAAVLVRRQAIRDIGGMDERIFLYGEDLDWCMRMWKGGWEVHVQPDAVFVHQFTRLSRRTLDLRSAPTRHHWASLVRLFWKYPGLFLGRGPRQAGDAIRRWSTEPRAATGS